jgi:hypothetical protein
MAVHHVEMHDVRAARLHLRQVFAEPRKIR